MTNIIGLTVFALGIVLLIFGFNESQSFTSEISKAFSGTPSNHSMWMIGGGAASVIGGLVLAIRSRRA